MHKYKTKIRGAPHPHAKSIDFEKMGKEGKAPVLVSGSGDIQYHKNLSSDWRDLLKTVDKRTGDPRYIKKNINY